MIWHNKIEIPDIEEGLFVYVFDDGVDVEEYEEDFFFAENLIKWAYWKDILKVIDFFENPIKIKEVDFRKIAIEKGYSNLEKFINDLKNERKAEWQK